MAVNYSGREYTVTIGTQDQSGQALGVATVDLIANHIFRLQTVNDINFSGAFTTAEVRKSGRRIMTAEDRFQKYGGGVWTWDFDHIIENEAVAQVLLKAIGNGQATTTSMVMNEANLAANQGYIDGAAGSTDYTCGIIIEKKGELEAN